MRTVGVIGLTLSIVVSTMTIPASSAKELGVDFSAVSKPVSSAASEIIPQTMRSDVLYSKVSWENLNPKLVRESAYRQVLARLRASKPMGDGWTHIHTKNADPKLSANIRADLKKMIGFYSNIKYVKDYTVIWAHPKDFKTLPKLLCDKFEFCEQLQPKDYCEVNYRADFEVNCYPKSDTSHLLQMYNHHGFTHFIQQRASQPGVPYGPNWFIEGTASYIGLFFGELPKKGAVDMGALLSWAKESIYEDQTAVKFAKPATRKNFIDGMIQSAKHGHKDAESSYILGYYLGSLATEVLIAVYGYDKFVEFFKSLESEEFYKSFERHFGLDHLAFYEKMASYAVYRFKTDNPY
jgi:hypothetical protein